MNFRPTVYIKDNKYTGEMVSKLVHDALAANYSIKAAKYSKALYYSDYIAVIDGVDGVDHCECTIDFSILAQFTSAYTFDAALLAGVLPNTVSVMVRDTSAVDSPWVEVAHDNGQGDFMGCPIDKDDASKGVFRVDGDRIDYATGTIENFVIGSGLAEPFTNYQVRVDFNMDCGLLERAGAKRGYFGIAKTVAVICIPLGRYDGFAYGIGGDKWKVICRCRRRI